MPTSADFVYRGIKLFAWCNFLLFVAYIRVREAQQCVFLFLDTDIKGQRRTLPDDWEDGGKAAKRRASEADRENVSSAFCSFGTCTDSGGN